MNASFFMPFSTKEVNEISAMLKKWELKMKNIPNSYKISFVFGGDNVVPEKIRDNKKMLTYTTFKVHLTPKMLFRLNKYLYLFETHCAFLPLFDPNLS